MQLCWHSRHLNYAPYNSWIIIYIQERESHIWESNLNLIEFCTLCNYKGINLDLFSNVYSAAVLLYIPQGSAAELERTQPWASVMEDNSTAARTFLPPRRPCAGRHISCHPVGCIDDKTCLLAALSLTTPSSNLVLRHGNCYFPQHYHQSPQPKDREELQNPNLFL